MEYEVGVDDFWDLHISGTGPIDQLTVYLGRRGHGKEAYPYFCGM